MNKGEAEKLADLLDTYSGLTFYPEVIEGTVPDDGQEWSVRAITPGGDDVLILWDVDMQIFGVPAHTGGETCNQEARDSGSRVTTHCQLPEGHKGRCEA